MPLFGALDAAVQDRAIAPAPKGQRKVVLATSIAETSLTIEGVRIVVDSGLARVPRYEPDIGLTRLETVRASRAAVDQRRGRAGRTEPGVCYRLWDEPQTASLAAYTQPEILSADLSSLVLDLAQWGVRDPATLAFLDPPPAPALKEANSLLGELGALDADGRITAEGQSLRALALPPRLARMIVDSHRLGAGEEAADIAAILTERGLGGDSVDLDAQARPVPPRPLAARFQRAQSGAALGAAGGDDGRAAWRGHLALHRHHAGAGLSRPRRAQPRQWQLRARQRPRRRRRADLVAGARALYRGRRTDRHRGAGAHSAGGADRAGRDRSALRRSDREQAKRFRSIAARWRCARAASGRCTRSRCRKRRSRCRPRQRPRASSPTGLVAAGLDKLPWSKSLKQWRDRVMFLRKAEGDSWPDLSDAALAADGENWLVPVLYDKTSLKELSAGDLSDALMALLPWELRARLEREAPTHFEAPTGTMLAIDYEAEQGPTIAVRLQELFGLNTHPSIAKGAVPLVLELLSPAQRPVQVTRDLPGFWRGSYAAVRSDLRGRYPRHPWPEDPATALPTRRVKPRGT